MLSVLCWKVVEPEQGVAILDEAFEPIIVLTPQVSTKASKAEGASFLISAIQTCCSAHLAFGCWLIGSLLRTLAVCSASAGDAPRPDRCRS
jgi:hypothetical protein